MSKSNKKDVFEKIYHSNSWGDKDSKSGTGSNLIQTEEIRLRLPGLLDELKVKSVLDIPCGDFFWMKEIKNEMSEIVDSYVGGDIVEEVVVKNNANFSSQKVKFEKLDLTSSLLPRVDLILCRDCLVHLSYRDIYKALKNIVRSGSKYLLTTSFNSNERINVNIRTGNWRPLNLQKFPFLFQEPTQVIVEKCTENGGIYSDKSLMLWKINTINTHVLRLEVIRSFVLGKSRQLLKKILR